MSGYPMVADLKKKKTKQEKYISYKREEASV